ncbi:hypothetical protein WKT22_00647 [Candidatus Lokiarchaeum ossiferum]
METEDLITTFFFTGGAKDGEDKIININRVNHY